MSQDHQEHVVAEWMSGNKPAALVPDALIIGLMLVVVFCSIWLQSADPAGNWFMRSGAVMVLLGAVLEYRHHKFNSEASIASIRWASGVGGPAIFEHSKARKAVGYVAHVSVVLGTFVAGYGDLIVSRFGAWSF